MEMIRKTSVLSFSDYLNEDNGFQIRMEDFDAELASAYKDSTGQDMTSTVANSDVKVKNSDGAKSGDSMGKTELDTFTLNARKSLPKSLSGLETTDLIDKNGNLKSRYTPGFIKAWGSAIDAVSGYFFYSGGLYETDNIKTSLNTPCNWPKWVTLNSQANGENINAFIVNYEFLYKTSFAKLPKDSKLKCIDLLVKADSISGKSYENMMSRLQQYVNEFKDSSFITYPALKGIKEDLNKLFNDDDWGFDEFVVFNNIVVILANSVSFNEGKILSGFRWIFENSNMIGEARRIASDKVLIGPNRDSPSALTIKSKDGNLSIILQSPNTANMQTGVKLGTKTNDAFSKITALTTSERNGISSILVQNIYYIVNDVYDSLIGHVRRMNAIEFSNIPQTTNLKTFDASK